MRESGAGLLLAGLLLLSAALITVEYTTRLLEQPRSMIGTLVSPLRVVAEVPYLLGEQFGDALSTRENLIADNEALRRQVLELSQVSQQFLALRSENERLRELLGSRRRVPHEVLVAELIGVVPGPSRLQIIIDKGSDADVRVGQAVVDAEGLFGQVVAVDKYTARVLLLSDSLHAVPAQINRTGQRGIVSGLGENIRLEMDGVPVNADIREGDLVVSSGLGGRFPVGYPIGHVDSVVVEPTSAFAQVSVRPAAQLDRSRHVLVVFPQDQASASSVVP
ncbi:MAG: rod shape-determining protein MreC [Pseudomonadales bacterium]